MTVSRSRVVFQLVDLARGWGLDLQCAPFVGCNVVLGVIVFDLEDLRKPFR